MFAQLLLLRILNILIFFKYNSSCHDFVCDLLMDDMLI